jgi:ornithine cyclodeaminase
MTDVLLLSSADLEELLDFASVLRALEEAFHAERQGLWDTPTRIAARTASGGLLAMPCGGGAPPGLGAKLVSTFPGNSSLGHPSVSGLYVLFDPVVGAPLSVMDGAYLTLIRTAFVSALATRALARSGAGTLGILGAGAQAGFHVRALALVRPIARVVIWARRKDQARELIATLRARADLQQVTAWEVAAEPDEAAGCDVVVTATGATEPVLSGRWLSDASHVNAIGTHTRDTRELDTEAVTRAVTLVVETAGTLAEAGDLQRADDEAGGVLTRVVTLGALLDPSFPSPRSGQWGAEGGISIFKSCGVAFEDLAVAALALRRARERGIGVRFAFT